jgi:hypothetical protein
MPFASTCIRMLQVQAAATRCAAHGPVPRGPDLMSWSRSFLLAAGILQSMLGASRV